MTALTIVAGELSYRFVEEPARRQGQRLLAHWGWAESRATRPPQRESELGPRAQLSPRR